MQARVIQGGQAGFDAMFYGTPSEELRSYLSNTINTASQKLGDGWSSFIDTAKGVYSQFNSNAAINASKALMMSLERHTNTDVILRYTEDTVFNATPTMQQYIMVQPELFELDRQQMCSAYDGMYYNIDPEVEDVKEHVRYKEVMDGMLQFEEDSGEGYYISYGDSEMEDLHFMDKISILDTWDAVANLIAEDIDPSSPEGLSL